MLRTKFVVVFIIYRHIKLRVLFFSGSLQLELKNVIFKVYEDISKSFADWVDN
jgi:hypothetical protein